MLAKPRKGQRLGPKSNRLKDGSTTIIFTQKIILCEKGEEIIGDLTVPMAPDYYRYHDIHSFKFGFKFPEIFTKLTKLSW